MIKETHTIELTVEMVADIIKRELDIHGEFNGDFYKLTREVNDDDDFDEHEVLQFTYNKPARELPF